MDLAYASLRRKATVYNVLASVVMGLFLLVLGYALYEVRINGPLYEKILRDQGLVADALPPTLYIVDPHLDVTDALLAAEQKDFDRSLLLAHRALSKQAEFDQHIQYWSHLIEQPNIKDAVVQKARVPAARYFDVVQHALLPSLERRDVVQARVIYDGTLMPLFQQHRQEIEDAIDLAKAESQRNEAAAARVVSWITVSVPVGALGLIFLCWWGLHRWWIQPMISRTNDVQEALARIGAGDLASPVTVGPHDEFGFILAAIESMRVRLNITVQELDAKRIAAQSAEQAKSDFLANMSHELRTPLNAVLGMTELLLRTDLGQRQRDLVGHAKEAGLALLGLLDQILDLAKIESDMIELESAPFALQEVLDRLTIIVGHKAQQKGLTWQLQIDPSTPKVLVGDALRLGQVLINLCGNAVKFTERGQVTVSVSPTELSASHCTLRFAICDSGIGMSEDQIARVFNPFTQADASMTRRYGGTGLGLTISKDLVQRMHGSIHVHSSLGRGSTFFFTALFGLMPTPQDTVVVPTDAGLTPGTQAANSTKEIKRDTAQWAGLQGKRVLLVEDNDINQLVVSELLQDVVGMQVTVASNGLAALEQIQSQPFDVILMDVQMPGMNGYETTRRLRAMGKGPAQLPVIAMTAHAMEQDREECLASGMDDYVSKPIVPERLFAALLKWACR